MFSPRDTSKHPFGPLQEREADHAMELQQELPPHTADNMPQTEATTSIEGILGPIERKRPAQHELPVRQTPKFSLAEARRDAPAQAPREISSLYNVPKKAPWQRCALSFDFDRTVGGVTVSPIDWVVSVRFDAGHLGNPKIMLEICVREVPTGQPLDKASVPVVELDIMRFTWIISAISKDNKQVISDLKSYNFTNFTGIMEMPFLQEASLIDNQKNLDQLWVVHSELGLPIVDDFHDAASWDLLPADLACPLEEMVEFDKRNFITFFFKPKKRLVVERHLPRLI
ncbi:MAG: hypothetical protein Q9210_006138, partial [Variospora velana]